MSKKLGLMNFNLNIMYTLTKLFLIDYVDNSSILELIDKISREYSALFCEFEDSVFEANFDFNIEKIVSLTNEYPDFRRIKLDFGDDNEFSILRKDKYIFSLETNHEIRDYYLNQIQIRWAITTDYRNYNTQTVTDPAYWRINKLKIPDDVELYPDPGDWRKEGLMLINEETLEGHEHIQKTDDKLWFGSCWQMYFSNLYYKYIPKELFDSFTNCEENIILENGIRRITLYKDPSQFELPESRARQWAFRRQLGIDSIAHELMPSRRRKEPAELPVLISIKKAEHGAIRVTRFLDANKKLVVPSKALFKEIIEYDESGLNRVFDEMIEV